MDITYRHLSKTLEAAKYGRAIPPWKSIEKKNAMRIWRKKEKESELKQREARRTTISGKK